MIRRRRFHRRPNRRHSPVVVPPERGIERWAHGELGDGRTGPQDADYPALDGAGGRPRLQRVPTRSYADQRPERPARSPRGAQHGYRVT